MDKRVNAIVEQLEGLTIAEVVRLLGEVEAVIRDVVRLNRGQVKAVEKKMLSARRDTVAGRERTRMYGLPPTE